MLPHLRNRPRHFTSRARALRASAGAVDAALLDLEASQAEVETEFRALESKLAIVGARLSASAPELVGVAEIAERLGLAGGKAVHALRARCEDFPSPIAQLRIGCVWSWSDVDDWAKALHRI